MAAAARSSIISPRTGPVARHEISEAFAITRAGARAQLIRLHAAGVVEIDDLGYAVAGVGRYRYYLEPDALRYAARWLVALAERAERANRGEVFAPRRAVAMNRDGRARWRREYRLRVPAGCGRHGPSSLSVDVEDIAPWVIATARAWPASVEDRLVAVRIGVQPQHVRVARESRR